MKFSFSRYYYERKILFSKYLTTLSRVKLLIISMWNIRLVGRTYLKADNEIFLFMIWDFAFGSLFRFCRLFIGNLLQVVFQN